MSDVEWDDIILHLFDGDDDLSNLEHCDAGGGGHDGIVALRRVGKVVVAAKHPLKRQRPKMDCVRTCAQTTEPLRALPGRCAHALGERCRSSR